jgi:transposase
MYYIGLDVHKKTISYCVKDATGQIHQEGKIGSTRRELDSWIKTLPQPRMIAMEATIFTGWIYDHLLPHAEKIKAAHPLMLSHCTQITDFAPNPRPRGTSRMQHFGGL